MREIMSLFAAATLMAMPAVLAAEGTGERAPPPKAPSAMTPTEISAYNKGLAQTDPNYIKCRKTLEIGSLVKKNRVCYTNEKWKEVSAKGSQNARDTAEAMTSKAGNSN
ncbi:MULTISPECIES: hypothetical protein [unclassified Sphingopyxis]|jgi:hypothetical protein|uniref:hypothetical protein n=1 Tax=unclassified Sphingopyxis TaxID=2614943 RepID=UPI00285C802C|nr:MULTISPECIES: hypothetical protein [unclassified Sphingopyxis]MDR6833186.1 hypothetical protein [Sphingopyxis sp. BE122]MDR7228929.1 hypothetical protein [Sphingopyxis sp. BE259]